MSVLHKMAARLDTFYQTAATELLLQPEHELNPARTRWNIVQSKIEDGSFFILCTPLELGSESQQYRSWRQILNNVKFKEVISRAQDTIAATIHESQNARELDEEEVSQPMSRPRGLAAAYIARASSASASSFETHIQEETMQRLSQFMETSSEAIPVVTS